jgi:hypothetical protein
MNVCFFLSCLGWLAQLGAKSDIVCRKVGTVPFSLWIPGTGYSLCFHFVFFSSEFFLELKGLSHEKNFKNSEVAHKSSRTAIFSKASSRAEISLSKVSPALIS